MENEDRWEQASGEFLDFVNEVIEGINDEKLTSQSGQMLSDFSFLIVSLDQDDEPDLEKLSKFAVSVHKSNFSEKDKKRIISKAQEILEKVFPDFYADYKYDIFHDFKI